MKWSLYYIMIKQYRIKLKPDNESALSSLSCYYLYGMLTELLDPEYASLLHDNSISPISQYIQINSTDNAVDWIVNLFNSEAAAQISPIL